MSSYKNNTTINSLIFNNNKNISSLKFIMLIDLMFKGTVKILSYSFLINPLNFNMKKENLKDLTNYCVCDTVIIHIKPEHIFNVLKFVKQSTFLSYNTLIDIFCVDLANYKNYNKLEASLRSKYGNLVFHYVLRSYITETKLIVKTRFDSFIFLKPSKPFINRLKILNLKKKKYSDIDLADSVTSLFKSAGWLEREIFDMFGVFFFGNEDIRRILNDYSFLGYPLLKNYPISGFFEMQYKPKKNIIQFNKAILIKEFNYNRNRINWA